MMLSALAPLRRQLALILAPELESNTAAYKGPIPVFRSVRGTTMRALDTVDSPRSDPRIVSLTYRVSTETEEVIRLGNLLVAATGMEDFVQAAGMSRLKPGRRDTPPTSKLYDIAVSLQRDWRPFAKRPPIEVSDRVYWRFLSEFSAIWPEATPWPSDIPRPPPLSRAEL